MRLVSGISRAIAPAYVRTIGSGCVLQVYLHDALRRSHLPLDVARCGAAACPADLFGPWTALRGVVVHHSRRCRDANNSESRAGCGALRCYL